MEQPEIAHTEQYCPRCHQSLDVTGVVESRDDTPIWTTWRWYGTRWDVKDEEFGEPSRVYLECGDCGSSLTETMSQTIWEEMNA